MTDDDDAHLREMLDRAYVCRQFVDGRSRSDLDDDLLLYFAVAKAVELIGEAAWKVSDSTQMQIPLIEWGSIVGMRHRLVHDFGGVSRDRVWAAAQDGVPTLIVRLQTALAQRDG